MLHANERTNHWDENEVKEKNVWLLFDVICEWTERRLWQKWCEEQLSGAFEWEQINFVPTVVLLSLIIHFTLINPPLPRNNFQNSQVQQVSLSSLALLPVPSNSRQRIFVVLISFSRLHPIHCFCSLFNLCISRLFSFSFCGGKISSFFPARKSSLVSFNLI